MIAVKYSLFAFISTLFNLLVQYLCFLIYTGYGGLYIAMFAGTIAGLFCKYILDKNFIFYHKPKGKLDDTKTFFRYTITGIFTTFLFWGTEISFDFYFTHGNSKYIGAALGLCMGYFLKYFLDKKYVFKGEIT